ncbi:MAG: GerAB/ArcD/ProY family transporter [Lachnospiraceae bacterium]|nr:GerAB/ArcD/ProY family transporter [Lachnospiraceae bacterium]
MNQSCIYNSSSDLYRINMRQLRCMTILETGTIGCLLITLRSGYNTGIFSVIICILLSLLYGILMVFIGRTDGGYYALVENTLPSLIRRGVWCIYSLRYAIHGAWLLSYLTYLIHETLYDRAYLWILLPLLFVCIYAGSKTIKERARFAELIFWWVLLPTGILFLIGIGKADLSIAAPPVSVPFRTILHDGCRLMPLYLPLELLIFRVSALSGSRKIIMKHSMITILLSGIWMLLVYTVTIGILGSTWGHDNLLGVTDAMEQIIKWDGIFERMDILFLLFWLAGSIYAITAYLFQGQQLLQRAFAINGISSRYTGSLWAVLLQTGIMCALFFLFPAADSWTTWYMRFACYIDIPLSIGMPIIFWLIYIICQYKKRRRITPGIQFKERAFKEFIVVMILISIGTLSGCIDTDSIEDRAYVKELHITGKDNDYEFRCILSYLSQDSIDTFHTDNSENNVFTEDQGIFEYDNHAQSIIQFNETFQKQTNCTFDYSHLQGIYLDHTLYVPSASAKLLRDIRTDTKAVLSTPIYAEDMQIGDQQEVTLGDRIKYNKEHSPE